MSLLIRWIFNAFALFVVVNVVPHVHYRSLVTLLIAAAVLGLLNAIVRPLLVALTLPLTIVTLGIFLLVLNAFMFELTSWLVPSLRVDSFGWAMVAAIVFSIVTLFTDRIGRARQREQ